MNPAISKLKEYLEELESVDAFESIEDQASHIGTINLVKSSIGQLELCEKYSINASSLVNELPDTEDPNLSFLAVYENESSDPSNWEEVFFDGQKVLLSSGDLVVRK